jgi:hypothetical protein
MDYLKKAKRYLAHSSSRLLSGGLGMDIDRQEQKKDELIYDMLKGHIYRLTNLLSITITIGRTFCKPSDTKFSHSCKGFVNGRHNLL